MKTDLYTKIILTVIAIALCAIVFQNTNFVAPAQASPTTSTPNISTPAPLETVDVRIVGVDNWVTIPVKVENTVDVKQR